MKPPSFISPSSVSDCTYMYEYPIHVHYIFVVGGRKIGFLICNHYWRSLNTVDTCWEEIEISKQLEEYIYFSCHFKSAFYKWQREYCYNFIQVYLLEITNLWQFLFCVIWWVLSSTVLTESVLDGVEFLSFHTCILIDFNIR